MVSVDVRGVDTIMVVHDRGSERRWYALIVVWWWPGLYSRVIVAATALVVVACYGGSIGLGWCWWTRWEVNNHPHNLREWWRHLTSLREGRRYAAACLLCRLKPSR